MDNQTGQTDKKVSMNLTQRDLENVVFIKKELNARQEVICVSRSLEITRSLLDEIKEGSKLLIENEQGKVKEVHIIF